MSRQPGTRFKDNAAKTRLLNGRRQVSNVRMQIGILVRSASSFAQESGTCLSIWHQAQCSWMLLFRWWYPWLQTGPRQSDPDDKVGETSLRRERGTEHCLFRKAGQPCERNLMSFS